MQRICSISSFVACDLETTGLDPASDEIIEVGLVRVEGGVVTDTLRTLVRPAVSLPMRVQRLTGLTQTDLEDAPVWTDVAPQVAAFIKEGPLLGHNVGFDAAFLKEQGLPVPRTVLDTVELARLVLPTLTGYSLEKLARLLGIEGGGRHRALEDAESAARVFLSLQDRLSAFEFQLLAQMLRLLERGDSPWTGVVQHALQHSASVFAATPLTASPETPDLACEPPPVPPSIPRALDVLGPESALKQMLPGWEYRPGQLEMARAVVNALDEKAMLMVEAGTGTGKSLAYLIPAAAWALENGERAVVSTHTVTLQEQLIAKDVPLVSAALGYEFAVAILKGRQHYLCRRRFELTQLGALDAAKALFLARINVWLSNSATGDRSELMMSAAERSYWGEIAAEHEGCLGSTCRRYGSCFAMRARRKAERAQIVITNHALLLADLQTDNRIIPDYGPLVIDEAHHLEGVATEQFGRTVTRQDIHQWVEMLERTAARLRETHPNVVRAEFAAAHAGVESALGTVGTFLLNALGDAETVSIDSSETLSEVTQCFEEARWQFFALASAVERSLGSGTDGPHGETAEQFALCVDRGRTLGESLSLILAGPGEGRVSWIERGFRDGGFTARTAPLEVGHLLSDGLFRRTAPVILTSATITVDGSFRYFAERTGLSLLPAGSVRKSMVDSSFDYDRQALLSVVTDLPAPEATPDTEYMDALSRGLESLILAAGGGVLVLFTSHKVLRGAYKKLKDRLGAYNISLLGHHIDGGRTRLLEAFQSGEQAVLFGAASFWEGIDVPGEALRCLVIVKLPFQPPNHPIAVARREHLTSLGRNAFNHLFLPQAVIRLKQGFGRLIRSSRDRGVVVVLDRRIIEKQYGSRFLRSLPVARWEKGSLDQVCARMAEWLREGGSI